MDGSNLNRTIATAFRCALHTLGKERGFLATVTHDEHRKEAKTPIKSVAEEQWTEERET